VLYYIVNFKQKGFVIISAEKSMRAVLCACYSNNFDYQNAPPGLLYLLDIYKVEIVELRKQKRIPSNKDIAQWDKYNILALIFGLLTRQRFIVSHLQTYVVLLVMILVLNQFNAK
jgi:hypothetical protein